MKPLELPDVRQTKDHDCGTAAWKTVYKWHTAKGTRSIVDLSSRIHGLDPASLESNIRVGKSWNVIAGEMMIDDLRFFCKSYRPVICLITRAFDFETCGHYVVVSGVHRNKVYFQDPYDGPNSLRIDDWAFGWHDRGRYSDFVSWGLVTWPK